MQLRFSSIIRHLFFTMFLSIFLISCGGGTKREQEKQLESKTIRAFVTIPPQAYFVERIGGSHVQVELLVQPGQAPETYLPLPEQVAKLNKAVVYFSIGIPVEEMFLASITSTLSKLRIVDTRRGVELIPIENIEQGSTSSRPSGGMDPHIWLDPRRVITQAENICRALKAIDPAHQEEFEKNLSRFVSDLNALDMEIESLLMPLRGSEFIVSHPVLGYFADRYGLKQVAIETGGKEPGAQEMTRIVERARGSGANIIFTQPQFSSNAAQTIAAEIGGTIMPIDPLRHDYLINLREIAIQISTGLVNTPITGIVL
ncbi:zinc ABC transporter substrate-binding protein [bacterium]|nr:zinc ABC transporter substrate-binding protein [bacterium]